MTELNETQRRRVERLQRLAQNLWWSWHEIAQRPFAMISPEQWEASNHDPQAVLRRTPPDRLAPILEDPEFRHLLRSAEQARDRAMTSPGWFGRRYGDDDRELRVAYFCSEFAIHESLPQYSGGLGVLAGDHMKSASDLGIPLVGVGLLYRHGYYQQRLDADGRTIVRYPHYDFDRLPIEDTGTSIECAIGSHRVRARVCRLQVGRVPIYLLDADLAENAPGDRKLTEGLYKGEPDLRLRQQVLLGVGGVLALHAVGEQITVDHLNEGHAAFACVQRLKEAIARGATLDDAIAEVQRRTVFTTHTPVPAGHDRYDLAAVYRALRSVLDDAGLRRSDLARLGGDPGVDKDQVCMTVLALRLANRVNGVARLHGRVSREMWHHIYPSRTIDHVPIGSITNGVHCRTWLAPEAESFWSKEVGLRLSRLTPDSNPWARAANVDSAALWTLRRQLRARLVRFVRERLIMQALRRGSDPGVIAELHDCLDDDALTIGFARRFATYKRAPLIFRDLERLRAILDSTDRPVQVLFAGKAHPRDEGGQELLRQIHDFAQQDGLRNHVAVLEDYDMHVGRMLTAGADVWLNNPIRPHEASGTSGMKPPMHGGINCSILDGWWPEGYDGHNGWIIGDETESDDNGARDDRDASMLYDVLEHQIVAEFYDRDEDGLPQRWLERAKASAATIPGRFNTHRMLGEYVRRMYLQAHRASSAVESAVGSG